MTSTDRPAATGSDAPAGASWRFFVAIALWIALVPLFAIFIVTVLSSTNVLIPLGLFGYQTPISSKISVFWSFVWIAAIAAVLVVVAVIARRAVVFLLAIGIVVSAGLGALVIYPSIATAMRADENVVHVDEGKQTQLPCSCLSGGDCDCPGE